MKESEDHSVVSNSLRPPGLYSPWNSPGQNTRVYSVEACPFSSRSFTPRDRTRVSCIARGFFTNWPISKITTVLLYCRIISIYCLVVFHFSVEIWFYLFFVNHSDYFQHKITKEDTEIPWLEINSDFPEVAWMQARLSSARWRDAWILCGDPRGNTSSPPHLDRGLTSLDTSRGSWTSRIQKLMRLDSSWKLIGIPISLCKLERDPWSPTSPPEVSVLSCQA